MKNLSLKAIYKLRKFDSIENTLRFSEIEILKLSFFDYSMFYTLLTSKFTN